MDERSYLARRLERFCAQLEQLLAQIEATQRELDDVKREISRDLGDGPESDDD